jgi:hypothetical protein
LRKVSIFNSQSPSPDHLTSRWIEHAPHNSR